MFYDNKDVIIYISEGENELYVWKEKANDKGSVTVKSDKIVILVKEGEKVAKIKLEIEDVMYIAEILKYEALKSYEDMKEMSMMLRQKFLQDELKDKDNDRVYG